MPKISVIVPVYNTEKYLRRCVDSILAQTFRDFELLLIDDGSTDSSPAICDEYANQDSRVRVFHKPNGGVSSARNLGLDNARGEWISFVDADDWIEDDLYINLYEQSKNCYPDIVVSDFLIDDKTDEKYIIFPEVNKSKEDFINSYFVCNWTVVWNALIKRNLIKFNNIRFNENLQIGEDFEFMTQVFYFSNKIEKICKASYHYNNFNFESTIHSLKFEDFQKIISAIICVITFFKSEKTYDKYKQVLCWKILRAKQDYVLSQETYSLFMQIYPESHKYIISCPFINFKIKIMMMLLTHNLKFLCRVLNKMRNFVIRVR